MINLMSSQFELYSASNKISNCVHSFILFECCLKQMNLNCEGKILSCSRRKKNFCMENSKHSFQAVLTKKNHIKLWILRTLKYFYRSETQINATKSISISVNLLKFIWILSIDAISSHLSFNENNYNKNHALFNTNHYSNL